MSDVKVFLLWKTLDPVTSESDMVLGFLRRQPENTEYVTSVCTGSLVLAAAGLLQGFKAAGHWMSRESLAELGVDVPSERVVIDRNRVTGGGVTAGIDFGLRLASLLRGEAEAKLIQLQIEYNPAPPFDAGSPQSAGPDLVEAVRQRAATLQPARRVVVERVKHRLG